MSRRPPLTDLPVEGCIAEVRDALAGAGHAVLHAPPGAGKTTIVPLRLLDEPWLAGERIVMLEPRRLAARAAAHRMAALLGEEVGGTVGYRTRDERKVGRDTRIEVVTEGILTRRLQHDPSLPGVGLVVVDEIHERNLQADLALALTLDARSVLRPELRVLAMSATLDTDRVAAVLGGGGSPAPVVASTGRSHPVDIRWRPPDPRDRPAEAVSAAVLQALRSDAGDVLVFLAGAADIRRVGLVPGTVVAARRRRAPALRRALARRTGPGAGPVAARTSTGGARHRHRRDQPHRGRRVDRGRQRTGAQPPLRPTERADPLAHRAQLASVGRPASRTGRAHRTGRGAIACGPRASTPTGGRSRRPRSSRSTWPGWPWSWPCGARRRATSRSSIRLRQRALADAHDLLVELGALDADHRVTAAGRAMAELPVHPRLAHMILAATDRGLGGVACALAALLEERDVLRGRPEELPTSVAERVRLIVDPRSSHPRPTGAPCSWCDGGPASCGVV